MTPGELADRLRKDFPEWTDDQADTAAQAVYRASKELEAQLAAERPPLSMLERFLSRRVLELEREIQVKDETLSALRNTVAALFRESDEHSRRAW